jgi:hypothetical protein
MRIVLATAFRRTAVPLLCYYAVTLGLPVVNGADVAAMAFVEHALVVLAIPPALIALVCTAREMSRCCTQRVRRLIPRAVREAPRV